MERKKVILIMPYDITYFPPVISLCNILSELSYDTVYIGSCSNSEVENKLQSIGVKLYKTFYGGNGVQRFFQQLQFRHTTRSILKKEYQENNTTLWILHTETISLFASFLGKYKVVAHLLEFKNPRKKLAYRLLSPFANIEKRLSRATAVVCSEYNRAQLQKSVFHLKKLPAVMPNKSYFKYADDNIDLPADVKNKLLKYQDKKIILYQGVFISERKLDDYIEALRFLPDEYILFLMGNENKLYNELKDKYESERVVFLSFLPPPLHLEITKLAHIGILTYIPTQGNLGQTINVLYCAPNKIYEYSKFGIPMIANDLPALKFAFSDYKAGICMDELNAERICEAIFNIEKEYKTYSNQSMKLYNSINLFDIVKNILGE